MRDSFLPFSPPCLGEEEIAEVVDTLRSDWITTGPKVRRFEEEFAAFVGAPAALAVSSGTDAMLVALAALGVGPGDAVITTPMTFCSTVHVIEHLGATPILVDVEPDTLNLDPRKVEEALARWEDQPQTTDRGPQRTAVSRQRSAVGRRPSAVGGRIKALLPVHLYGHPCDMDALTEIARKHGLAIVEDAAHALPAKYKGRTIGSLPTADDGPQTAVGGLPSAVCFSFYATKNLTTAEGGMLTGPPDLVEEARIWSLHGMSRDAWKRYSAEGSWYYEVVRPGFKCNMTDIQAALGLHQLRKLPQFQARRREIVQRYHEAFSQWEELQVPTERPEVEHAWHLYVLRLNLERFRPSAASGQPSAVRNRFIEELRARNIGTSVHFIPVHLHPYYRDTYGYKPEDFPVAYREYQRIVSLPLYPRMSDQDVQDVVDAVVEVVKQYRR
jgi:dTDP-4-amino-4,6-dideoxygalactose transaminase